MTNPIGSEQFKAQIIISKYNFLLKGMADLKTVTENTRKWDTSNSREDIKDWMDSHYSESLTFSAKENTVWASMKHINSLNLCIHDT